MRGNPEKILELENVTLVFECEDARSRFVKRSVFFFGGGNMGGERKRIDLFKLFVWDPRFRRTSQVVRDKIANLSHDRCWKTRQN